MRLALFALRLPALAALWVVIGPLRAVAVLAGVFIVPVALRFAKDGSLPRWAWLWDNDRDGLDGPEWYRERYTPGSRVAAWVKARWPRYWWLAWRNPANNTRFAWPFELDLEPAAVEFVGDDFEDFTPATARREGRAIWFVAWQGLRGGFWFIRPWGDASHFRLRLGWKVLPLHSHAPLKHPTVGVGFQLMPNRNG